MNYRDIIFDLDGTLIDSGEGIMNSATYALHKMGITDFTREQLRVFVGPPLTETFAKFGVKKNDINEAVEQYRIHYNEIGKLENDAYDGIENVLKHLKNAGCHLYVGTSKPEALAIEILERLHLDTYFEIIAGATFGLERNSKEAVLRYLLEKTQMQKPLMVGDTVYDVVGANALGIDCIGVTWGYGDVQQMKDANAKHIVSSMQQLQDFILEDEVSK